MENDIENLKQDLRGHIEKHDVDYKNLLWWIIGTMVILTSASVGFFFQYGVLENRVVQVEKNQANFVSNVELAGAIALFDEKLKNISENLKDIKNGLNIK